MFGRVESELNSDNYISIGKTCSYLGVSRSGFYNWQKRKNSGKSNDTYEMSIKDEIQKIVVSFTGYGYRRVTKELHRRGYLINSKRVLRLMKEDNLLCVKKRFTPLTTNSNHNFPVYPNLIKNISLSGLNQVWASDITYIHLLREFIYLAAIIDIFSRKCIGWEIDRNIDTQLTLNALRKALEKRWNPDVKGLIHHSDQGVQYASNDYINCLKKYNIRISMSRKGNPYDNAFVESFIKTLKYEEVYISEYETFNEAYQNIENFIEEVYNKKRLHSSIGYLPPDEFEAGINLNILP